MKPGILVISHGSREPEWMAEVERTVEAARVHLAAWQRSVAVEAGVRNSGIDEAAAVERDSIDDGVTAWNWNDIDDSVVALKRNSTEDRTPSADRKIEDAASALIPSAQASIPIVAGYLELVEGRLIQDGVHALEALGVTDILAIPLFVSAGSTHVDEIGWALGAYETPRRETDLAPVTVKARLTYGTPIGNDPEIARVLGDKLAAVSREPAEESVLLIGHGSDQPWFYEAWRAGLEGLAAELKRIGGYADVEVALLRPDEPAARVALLRERRPETRVLAVPVFLSEGYFTSEVIPRRLAGLNCEYAEGALLPHPLMSAWIVHRAQSWLAEVGKVSIEAVQDRA